MKLTFHTTVTGDCTTIETENNLYLVDCGYGPDYEEIVRESGYGGIRGLILTHAHADHWGALPQVLPLMNTGGHWIAKSGTAFTRELMVQQKPYCKAQQPIDFWNAALAYLSIPSAPIPSCEMDGYTFVDLNADNSGQVITTNEWDHSLIHKGCIVPMINFGYGLCILGSDLEAPLWDEFLATDKLPNKKTPGLPEPNSCVHILQVPNHGQAQGRLSKRVLRRLNPGYAIISDADPDDNDNREYYENNGPYTGWGRNIISLKEQGAQSFRITRSGVNKCE